MYDTYHRKSDSFQNFMMINKYDLTSFRTRGRIKINIWKFICLKLTRSNAQNLFVACRNYIQTVYRQG